MYHLAVDIGGSNGRVVVFRDLDHRHEIASRRFSMTEHSEAEPGDFEEDFRNLVTACEQLLLKYRIEAVGMGLAGKFNVSGTELVKAGNIAHWVGKPIQHLLQTALSVPVHVDNDALAGALAEAKWGLCTRAPYRMRHFLYVVHGSGVGGAGIRFNHEGGITAIRGEFGHITVDPCESRQCRGCDAPGHLEALCGGNNLPLVFGKPVGQMTPANWQEVTDLMYEGLRTILQVQPADLIIFCGGVACGQPTMLRRLQRMLRESEEPNMQVRLSDFGETAGIKGALALLAA